MQVSIDSYPLTDGTLSGGFALSQLRINVQRIFDIFIASPATHGLLVIGRRYFIKEYHSGDDFTNVGAINITGDIFFATGTTPSVWTFFSVLVPFGPVLLDRNIIRTSIDFQVTRLHDSFAAADIYVTDIDSIIPSDGAVEFTSTFGSVRFLIHAVLISHQLVKLNGKATTHAYHIEGGRFNTSPAYYIITQDDFYILQEDLSRIETEH